MFTHHHVKRQFQPSPLTFRPWRLLLLLLAVAMLTAGSFGTALAGRVEEPGESGGRDFYEVELPNGNMLSFIPVHDESGRLLGYGISESMQPGTSSYHEIRELHSAGPAEIFHALTPPDTIMPADMAEAFDQPSLKTQGWALDHPFWPKFGEQCDQLTFQESYPNFPGYGGHTTSFSDGPLTRPDRWYWDLSTNYPNQYEDPYIDGLSTDRKVDNVQNYYAKVARCRVADYTYQGGPGVRLNGVQNGIPFAVWLGPLPNYGSSVDFTWYSATPLPPVDWILTVYTAWSGDEFHIGYVYSKP